MSEKFYVYSKSGCGYCERLIQFMDSKGIQYEKFDLGQDYSPEEFYNKFGRGSTFPQVNYKHQNIGGMRETVQYMVENKLVR